MQRSTSGHVGPHTHTHWDVRSSNIPTNLQHADPQNYNVHHKWQLMCIEEPIFFQSIDTYKMKILCLNLTKHQFVSKLCHSKLTGFKLLLGMKVFVAVDAAPSLYCVSDM